MFDFEAHFSTRRNENYLGLPLRFTVFTANTRRPITGYISHKISDYFRSLDANFSMK